jgi:hypothetical protein
MGKVARIVGSSIVVLFVLALFVGLQLSPFFDWQGATEARFRIIYKHTGGDNVCETRALGLREVVDHSVRGDGRFKLEHFPSDGVPNFEPQEAEVRSVEVSGLEGMAMIPQCLVPILAFILGGPLLSWWWKNYEEVIHSDYHHASRKGVGHLLKRHAWLTKYGLAKLHSSTDVVFTHYYGALKLITRGYRRLYEESNKNGPIVVTLYFHQDLSGIWRRLTDLPGSGELQDLFDLWDEMSKENDVKMRRVLVCDEIAYAAGLRSTVDVDGARKSLFDWYLDRYPNIPLFNLAPDKREDVRTVLSNLRGDEPDFAVFEGANEKLCVGFLQGRLTYVLLGEEQMGRARQQLHTIASMIVGSQVESDPETDCDA